MHRRLRVSAIGAVVLALGAAACSSDPSTGPGLTVSDAQIDQDIAADAGEAIGTSVDLMGNDEVTVGAAADRRTSAAGLALSVSAGAMTVVCTGPDGDGWSTCDATRWNGLDVTRQLRFWAGRAFDVAWNAPDPTDSMNVRRVVSGSYTPAWNARRTIWVHATDTASMAVDRASAPVRHIWTGIAARVDSARVDAADATRTLHETAFDTATAVTFAMPRAEHPWPESGTATRSVTTLVVAQAGGRSVSKTVTRRVMVTFNGTATVPLEVGGLRCALDLATHAISDCQGS